MQKIAAIHDGSPQGWETIYLAFHVAARLGAALLVLTLPGDEKQQSPSEQIEKIQTGGHAAGLSVETHSIDRISAEAVLEHGRNFYTLLLPKDLACQQRQVPALAQALSCPVWIVTGKYEIRQLGALVASLAHDFASQYSRALARRLGQRLTFLTNERAAAAADDEDASWATLDEMSARAIAEQITLRHIDLLIFASRDASFFEDCISTLSCILVLCPPEAGEALN